MLWIFVSGEGGVGTLPTSKRKGQRDAPVFPVDFVANKGPAPPRTGPLPVMCHQTKKKQAGKKGSMKKIAQKKIAG